MKTKLDATKRAKEVLRLVKTNGWKICVWENLGWHWCLEAHDGFLTLREHDGKFGCMLSTSYRHAGDYSWRQTRSFKDPNKAIIDQLVLVDSHVDSVGKFAADVKLSIGMKP